MFHYSVRNLFRLRIVYEFNFLVPASFYVNRFEMKLQDESFPNFPVCEHYYSTEKNV